MGTYKVGVGEDTWDFFQAYEAMHDGDTIEFEEGFGLTLNDGSFTIKKNINLLGNVSLNKDGSKMYNCAVYGGLFVEAANVSISSLWIEPNNGSTALWVKNKATISVKDCQLEFSGESNKYGVMVEEESKGTIENLFISSTEGAAYNFGVRGSSQLEMTDSNIVTLFSSDSEVDLQNTTIEGKTNTNSVNLKSSKVTIKNVTILSDHTDYPAVWCEKTAISSEHSTVKQAQYQSAIYLCKDSVLTSEKDKFTSVQSVNSRVILKQSVIDEIVYLSGQSYAKADQLELLGQNDTKIDVFVTQDSALIADEVLLHRTFNPNIRVTEQGFLNIEQLQFPEGNTEDIKFEVDSTSVSHRKAPVVEAPSASQEPSEEKEGNALEELNALVGLTRVKKEIDKMIKVVKVNQQRAAQGLPPIKQSLHTILMGNPGTGKTEVAKLMGRVLFENGVLTGDEPKFVQVTEADLVANIIGGTKINTTNKLEEAKGGILFIDEAYTLNKKGSNTNFGQEAIDTIMEYMEAHRDEIMILFAGYRKEMEEFLRTNPGLESRIQNKLIFDDYTSEEIIEIGEQIIAKNKFQLEDRDYYAKHVAQAYEASLDKSNARWIRKFNEALTGAFVLRVASEGSTDVSTIKNSDIDALLSKDKFIQGESGDALDELNNLIGIQSVKKQVEQFIAVTEFNKKREEQGGVASQSTLHSLFLGNPGTGKTTVAKLLGKILYQKDIIKQNKYVKATRSSLVAGYLGQTAIKTREVLMSALGGVLFIDEAYSLYRDSHDSFGLEAINEILEFMEEHRKEIVIIFAGYTKEMNDFLAANSGLTSRIPTSFEFEDYTPEELIQIGEMDLKKQLFQFDHQEYSAAVVDAYAIATDKSNGRWIRNFNEKLTGYVSSRIMREKSDDLSLITSEDIKQTREEYHV